MTAARRERRVEDTRVAILEAAAGAFAKKGVERTTMQDIARESGYTAASLYAYFPGKVAIVEGLLALLHRELVETFELPLPPGLAFAQSLELLVRRQLELAEKRRDAMSVFIECGHSVRSIEFVRGEAGFDVYVPLMAAWFARTAGPRDLGTLGPDEAAVCFAGLTHGFFHRWLRAGEAHPLSTLAHYLVQLFLHGVRGTARKPATAGRRPR